jgi:hypothetical protein
MSLFEPGPAVGYKRNMNPSKLAVILAHAFVGRALCAATMGISLTALSPDMALLVHAVAAPVFFAGISGVYCKGVL